MWFQWPSVQILFFKHALRLFWNYVWSMLTSIHWINSLSIEPGQSHPVCWLTEASLTFIILYKGNRITNIVFFFVGKRSTHYGFWMVGFWFVHEQKQLQCGWIDCLLRNEILGAFVLRKSLSQVVALLLDGWLQTLLPNSKVPECVKSKSPLVFPRVAIRYHQPFKKGTKSIVRGKKSI